MILASAVKIEIERQLAHGNISVDWSTLMLMENQGFMTCASTVESSLGKLVIHFNPTPLAEQRRMVMVKKIPAVTKFLAIHTPTTPIPKTLAAAELKDGSYFFVQKYLEGTRLGSRNMKKGEIIDTYEISKEHINSLIAQVDRYMGTLHNLKVPGFGFIVADNKGVVRGNYRCWEDFLRQESNNWLSELSATAMDETSSEKLKTFATALTKLLDSSEAFLELPDGHFVHGDIVNPSNILVVGNSVTGVIDFEWSLSGDPAWEYAHTEQRPTESYFLIRNITSRDEKREFMRRIDFNTVFWSLWGAQVHARINKYGLKEALLERAETYLHKLQQA